MEIRDGGISLIFAACMNEDIDSLPWHLKNIPLCETLIRARDKEFVHALGKDFSVNIECLDKCNSICAESAVKIGTIFCPV